MLKIKTLLCAVVLAASALAASAENIVHTVARGETLESIASRYNTTVEAIREANPDLDNLLYTGLKITVPVGAESAVSEPEFIDKTDAGQDVFIPLSDDDAVVKVEAKSGLLGADPSEFSCIYASYFGEYQAFDYGYYGIGWIGLNQNGWGGTFSYHGNWGIVDDGSLMFRFGPMYGLAINDNIMACVQLRGFIYTYDVPSEKTANGTDMKYNGGILLSPGVRLRYQKLSLGVSFDLGWCNDYNKLYSGVELSVGYKI